MIELKIDLHVHTNHSDSMSSVKEVVTSAKKKGLDGIAITDHDTMTAIDSALKLAEDLIIIPGVEISRKEGHILLLGINPPLPKGFNTVELIENVKKADGVVIIAHPNVPFKRFTEEAILKIRPDAIETYNAKTPLSRWMIKKNIKLAMRLGLPQTGGSDSHMKHTIGDMYTIVQTNSKTVKDILEAIRRGNIKPSGKPSPLWERPVWIVRALSRTVGRALGKRNDFSNP